MNTKTLIRKTYLSGLMLAFYLFAGAQTCDTTLVNARVYPAGFTRLYVSGQPCSIYYVKDSNMFGIDARLLAARMGVPQLVINDSVENAAIVSALFGQGTFPTYPEIWLGITDSASTYTWRTFTGAALPAYTNWSSGEPNNLPPSCQTLGICLCTGRPHDTYWCAYGEDCAVLNASGQWLDNTCEGDGVTRAVVLELNTCPVLTKPADMSICAGTSVTVTATDSSGAAPVTYTWNPGNLTGQAVSLSPASADTVTVHSSDAFHCIIDSSFIISIYQKPSSPPAITAISRDTLTTSTYSGYQWLLNDTVLKNDTTKTITPTANGPYQVVALDSNGCHDTSAVYTVMGVGIHEIIAKGNILLYPNPNNGSFILESNNCIGREFVIYDMLGRVVVTQSINSNNQSITLKGLSPGTYTLETKGNPANSIRFTVEN